MSEITLAARTAAITLLARGMATDSVGAEVGVNGRTVRRWVEDPDYARLVQDARQAILAEAVGALTAAVRDAVATLHDALKHDSAVIRVRAAAELLKALPPLSDHADLNARLSALEARLTETEGSTWQAA